MSKREDSKVVARSVLSGWGRWRFLKVQFLSFLYQTPTQARCNLVRSKAQSAPLLSSILVFFLCAFVCHESVHSFFFIDCQSLRELRIMSVLIIAAIQKEMWVGFKCNGPVNFSQRGGISNTTHEFSRPAPPPPHQASSPLLGNPPPFFPKLRCCREAGTSLALGLWQGCSLQRRVTHQIWRGKLAYLMDQSRGRIRSEHRRQEMTNSDSSPSPPRLSMSLVRDWRQIGGEGGRNKAWVCPWSTYAQLVPERQL